MATYYFNNAASDNNWSTLGNWWLDSDGTLSASQLPGPSDDVYSYGQLSFFPEEPVIVKNAYFYNYIDPSQGNSYSLSAQKIVIFETEVNFITLSGDVTYFQVTDGGETIIYGNLTLSGSNYTQSTSVVNGNLIIYYPTIFGDLSLPTVNGTTTLVNYKFEEYPDYNFTISGLSVSSANVFYGYVGFYNGKHQWNSLDGTYSVYYNGSYDNKWWLEADNNDFGITSDQQNIDYPWNITSWTLDYGELDGTPIFNLVPFNKSNIIVSGIGDSGVEGLDLNGEYVLGYRGFGSWWGDVNGEQDGTNQDRPFYTKTNGSNSYFDWSYLIRWNDSWVIYNENATNSTVFDSDGAVPYYPTEVETWYPGQVPGTPVLTFASSQNTFGLPEASVALITQNFGSVANYLRLRNLGQV